jgi:4-hydroxy-2-oxoheptanedioate aldolase
VNNEVLCLVMVETIDGIDNVEAIAAEPGVDGIYIGPADLAVSMGLKPGIALQDGPHAEAVARIVAACRAAGKVAAMSGNPQALADLGFRMATAGSDSGFLQAGLTRTVELRAEFA